MQVLPIPKARGVGLNETDLYTSGRADRRAEKKKEEERIKNEEKQRNKELALANSTSTNKAKRSRNKSSTDLTKDATAAPAPKLKVFGVEETPDFEEGKRNEAKAVQIPCLWDEPITYELQVCKRLVITYKHIAYQ